jgi:hypothetical protein
VSVIHLPLLVSHATGREYRAVVDESLVSQPGQPESDRVEWPHDGPGRRVGQDAQGGETEAGT